MDFHRVRLHDCGILLVKTGAQLGGGMALVIAGGLMYATLMTLFIIPVMYDILFKRQPTNVDIGSEDLEQELDDAGEFIRQNQSAT